MHELCLFWLITCNSSTIITRNFNNKILQHQLVREIYLAQNFWTVEYLLRIYPVCCLWNMLVTCIRYHMFTYVECFSQKIKCSLHNWSYLEAEITIQYYFVKENYKIVYMTVDQNEIFLYWFCTPQPIRFISCEQRKH
jgi:hypothetical protein